MQPITIAPIITLILNQLIQPQIPTFPPILPHPHTHTHTHTHTHAHANTLALILIQSKRRNTTTFSHPIQPQPSNNNLLCFNFLLTNNLIKLAINEMIVQHLGNLIRSG